jgi:hypothetical protein
MHAMTRFIRGLSPESKRALLEAEGTERRKALRGLADSTDDTEARRFLAAYLRDPSLDPDRVGVEPKVKAVAEKLRRIESDAGEAPAPKTPRVHPGKTRRLPAKTAAAESPAPPMGVRKVHRPEGGRSAGTAWSPPPAEQGAKRTRPGSAWTNPAAGGGHEEAPEPDDAT